MSERGGEARAVVVGVAETTYAPGRFRELPGARVDATAVAALLRSRGFEVEELVDPLRVTCARVADALATLVATTVAGDLSVIYLAGHGFQTKAVARDEDDGWDEVFVCGDGAIRDNWFREELWPTAREGARFVVVVDACHSNSITLGMRARSDTPPAPTVAPLQRSRYYRLTLAACRDEESALEVARCDSGEGVVTSTLLQVLNTDPGQSYQMVWSTVAERVRDGYAHRKVGTPQLDSYGPDFALQRSPAFQWPLPAIAPE